MNLKEVLLAVETGTSETGHAEWLEVHIQSFKDCVGRWIDDSLYWQRKRWKARTWAKTWKRAAKEWRANAKWWEECFFDINAMLDTAKRETKEARAWPIRMAEAEKLATSHLEQVEREWAELWRADRDRLQAELRELQVTLDEWQGKYFDRAHESESMESQVIALQAELATVTQERDDIRFAPNMALVRVAELEEERQAFADTCDMYYAQIEGLTQERDELQARVETLEALNQKHCEAGWKLVDEKKALQVESPNPDTPAPPCQTRRGPPSFHALPCRA